MRRASRPRAICSRAGRERYEHRRAYHDRVRPAPTEPAAGWHETDREIEALRTSIEADKKMRFDPAVRRNWILCVMPVGDELHEIVGHIAARRIRLRDADRRNRLSVAEGDEADAIERVHSQATDLAQRIHAVSAELPALVPSNIAQRRERLSALVAALGVVPIDDEVADGDVVALLTAKREALSALNARTGCESWPGLPPPRPEPSG